MGDVPTETTSIDAALAQAALAQAAHGRRASFHKPFHAGKRLIKTVGGYDDGIFFAYNAVPYGRQAKQPGKHRLIRPYDEDSSTWGHPMSLEDFVRRGRKDIRKRFLTALGRRHAHQTMDAVECLRVGQSVYFYFWAWGTLAKRVK